MQHHSSSRGSGCTSYCRHCCVRCDTGTSHSLSRNNTDTLFITSVVPTAVWATATVPTVPASVWSPTTSVLSPIVSVRQLSYDRFWQIWLQTRSRSYNCWITHRVQRDWSIRITLVQIDHCDQYIKPNDNVRHRSSIGRNQTLDHNAIGLCDWFVGKQCGVIEVVATRIKRWTTKDQLRRIAIDEKFTIPPLSK